jgi:hypothetical protein
MGDVAQPIVSSVSGSEAENTDATARKKSRVTFSMDIGSQSSPMSASDNQSKDVAIPPKDSSSNVSRKLVDRSARAQRSLRRQTNVVKEPDHVARNQQKLGLLKRQLVSANESNPSLLQKQKANKNEEVVKIKLNTGTLLLYKGANRRVVFLRRC